ncbi:response regulator [Paenibacillus thalictri]|uniref:Response regulator n=1 Tax=Paenibacillus thalictri TaxID=2527873 RepID=A0A4Q9DD25_9BACL|nr:response regulator [Paenibacillus thalictri]TBL68607.1 response regulator [Paenibacillus thalictri]
MFRVMIVEDEQPILELMKYIIGQSPHYTIAGVFTNPLEALDCLPQLEPDVAFIDVEMPKMNGLELARHINEITDDIKIVFTTAYKQYALEAFEVYAFDYILKPVTPAAIERIASRLLRQLLPAPAAEPERKQTLIRCFGGFEIRNKKDEPVHFPTRKAEELFAFFLCHPGKELSKWTLTDMLWPEMEGDRPLHNLYNTIYRLKKLLKEHEIEMDIRKINEGYILDTSLVSYDVLAFVREGIMAGDHAQDMSQAEQLFSLYRGPLLETKDYTWKFPIEEGYSRQYAGLTRKLVEAEMAGREWSKAERRLDVYLSLYPLDEKMNRLLMDLYVSSGSVEKIAKHYERFEAACLQELGVEPSPEMKNRAAPYLP